ncbi:hypothetical protein SM907_24980 (plasmid) [Klebsiella aerogenes]|uniref:hypothetical protein n=1 Tax=Klebsiella aerogenes TaxID=548 RepID=UPI002A8287D8|nr:hypothetical protein [Klebsiella aerogenes]WPS10972.1 hypothetical protein SM907_24980 [Klebsiella aerogenes]
MKDNQSRVQNYSKLIVKNLYFKYMILVVILIVTSVFIISHAGLFLNGLRGVWALLGSNVYLTIILIVGAVFSMMLSLPVGGYPYDDFRPALIIYGFLISLSSQLFAVLLVQAWEWGIFPVGLTFILVHFLSGFLIGGTQKDVTEKRVPNDILYIIPEFWVLLPMVGFGWGVSWAYHQALFN